MNSGKRMGISTHRYLPNRMTIGSIVFIGLRVTILKSILRVRMGKVEVRTADNHVIIDNGVPTAIGAAIGNKVFIGDRATVLTDAPSQLVACGTPAGTSVGLKIWMPR